MQQQRQQRNVVLDEMSWPDAKSLLSKAKIALVPVGATEQHGPYLPLSVDTLSPTAVCRRLAQRVYPLAIVAPPIPVGISFSHMTYPGTLAIRETTLIAYAYDVADSLVAHGIKTLLFVNGHGGNLPALSVASERIRRGLGIRCAPLNYWDFYRGKEAAPMEDGELPGHSGEFETSMILRLRPELVAKSFRRAKDNPNRDKKSEEVLLRLRDFSALSQSTKTGIYRGNPSKASERKGEAILEIVSTELAGFLDQVLQVYNKN